MNYLPGAMHPLQDTSYNAAPVLNDQPVQHIRHTGMIATVVAPETGTRDATKIEHLDRSRRELFDLSSLEDLTNLETLNLRHNPNRRSLAAGEDARSRSTRLKQQRHIGSCAARLSHGVACA